MDPLGLILAALTAGATAGVQGAAGEAVKDAYNSLKELLKRKLGSKPEAQMVLSKHEEKPSVWEAPLRDALGQVAADQDSEVITSAQNLLTLINPQQAAKGKYNIQISGSVQGLVQGDNASVHMTFGDAPAKRK